MRSSPNARELITALDLEQHVEGGYFRRTFQSDRPMVATERGQRYLMTSIYYLLTQDSPIGYFHFNQSDIVHYYHLGDAIEYSLIFPDGTLQTVVMGSDVVGGQCLQLHVPGGTWKASQIIDGPAGYGLISEAVSPGFDYADMEMSDRQKLTAEFPQHAALIGKMTQG
ncbi:cupin domain-containing protein [Pseudomonas sp. B21-053]|uniref:cupin domain-containing protein n=1 Tax=Pseudomonas sp. B21-053 TaxID=2895493 RepID=UPI00222FC02E|nr:cupin domain-containing protein [Pseudomonas sp. B21-053]UZE09174.1 cupin domain-containing protein [Pseudomonas sp. B21-053]